MVNFTLQDINILDNKIQAFKESLNIEKQQIIVDELTMKSADPNFWDDFENATRISKELNEATDKIELIHSLETSIKMLYDDYEDAKGIEDDDTDNYLNMSYEEIYNDFISITERFKVTDPSDDMDCVLQISAGAGGTEANDWAKMLFRMYNMWAKANGFEFNLTYASLGDKVGIKTAFINIIGKGAYGKLKSETGVHRLVRVSPYNAQGKRMTSFAAVFVSPLIDDTITVDINEGDITFETFRSSGAGGQNVNKVESGVRARYWYTDADTGEKEEIIVANTETRDQPKNKENAIRILKSIVYKKLLDKQLAKKREIEDSKLKNEWGAQIRSYVFDDRRVKDHRTGYQTTDVDSVMNGNINGFIEAYTNYLIQNEAEHCI